MKITLNGEKIDVAAGMTLDGLISMKGLEPERIVVEYNMALARKEEWDRIVLKEDDNIEILRFVGGG